MDGSHGQPARRSEGQWISRIEPGWKDDRSAYLVVSAYRTGNYAPLVYRTGDLGRTWQSVAGDLPSEWPARVVREDPENPNLLFAGTEIGLYASFDRGTSWIAFGNLPTVPVDDILVHPREHDLVIATHGRSLYIVDNIRALENLTPGVLGEARTCFQSRRLSDTSRFRAGSIPRDPRSSRGRIHPWGRGSM